jgi:hypothetical protein
MPLVPGYLRYPLIWVYPVDRENSRASCSDRRGLGSPLYSIYTHFHNHIVYIALRYLQHFKVPIQAAIPREVQRAITGLNSMLFDVHVIVQTISLPPIRFS